MPLLPFSGPVIPTPVPISKGGTGSATQNFVDLSSTQIKTGGLTVPLTDRGGQVFNVKAYGAKGNGNVVTDGVMTASSATLTSSTANFTANDVGKTVSVVGAGASGAILNTTISGYTNATTVTLAANAGTTVSSATAVYGTDDTSAINSAIAALPSGGGVVYFPAGTYVISSTISILAHGVWLVGAEFASTFADQSANQPGMTGIARIVGNGNMASSTDLVTFGQLGTSKLWTGGGLNKLVLQNIVSTPGNGVSILNVQAARVLNCGITGAKHGVYVKSDLSGGISNVDVEHNIIYYLKGNGVLMDTGSEENYVRYNYVSDAVGYGICAHGTGNTILGNHVEGTTSGGGTYRAGADYYVDGQQCFILNNDTLGGARDGIYVGNSTITVQGNTIRDINTGSFSDGSGIFVENGITNVLIAGNNIKDSNSHMVYGIYDKSSTAGGVLLVGNKASGYTTADFYSVNNKLATINNIATARSTVPQNTNMFEGYVGTSQYFGVRNTTNGTEVQSYSNAPLLLNNQGNGVGIGQNSATAALDVTAATTSKASFRLRSGTAPTTPNAGDMWFDGTQLNFYNGSATQNFVDLSSPQTVGGDKTFTSQPTVSVNGQSLFLGNNTNAQSFVNFNARGYFGYYNGSGYAVVQGTSGHGIGFAVNNSTFGSGQVAQFDTSGNFEPATNNTYTNGTPSLYWSNLYATTLNLNSTASLSGSTAGQVTTTAGNYTEALGSANQGYLLTASSGDASFGVKSTGGGAYVNIFANNTQYNAVTGWAAGSPVWRVGRFANSAGFSIYTSNGATQAAYFDDSQNTTLYGNLTLSTHNLVTDTTTGTQLATVGGASGQKLAFWGSTPIVQPLLATGASHTVDDVITVLQNLGLVRQS